MRSPKYHLVPADLRAPPSEALGSVLTSTDLNQEPLLSPSLPTLIIFECVLAYMSTEASSKLLSWFVHYASSGAGVLGCVIYEMFGLHDSFGKVMVNNLKVRAPSPSSPSLNSCVLKARNVTLPGAEPFTTLDSLSKRFTDVGFSAGRALTLKEIKRAYIEQSELDRYVLPPCPGIAANFVQGFRSSNSWMKRRNSTLSWNTMPFHGVCISLIPTRSQLGDTGG